MGYEELSGPREEVFFEPERGEKLLARIESGIEAVDAKTGLPVFDERAKQRIREALALAIELHGDEKLRDDGTPYVEHVLRVADQVLNSFKITDPNVIIAALLHDSIENQRIKLAEKLYQDQPNERHAVPNVKNAAVRYLAADFGVTVASMVVELTKPDKADYPTLEARDADYLAQLRVDMQTPELFYVKLADFFDNVRSLEGAGTIEHQQQRAAKYQPVFDMFIERIQDEEIQIPVAVKRGLIRQLLEARALINRILTAARLTEAV